MVTYFPKEAQAEPRVALLPENVEKWKTLGARVVIESGLGNHLDLPDQIYSDAGAEIVPDRNQGLAEADLVLQVGCRPDEEIPKLKSGAVHISFLDPFRNREVVDHMADQNVSAISLEMMPRTTIAQKMDAVSSQASLAGYAVVLLAARRLDRVFPMMMTPAGTLSPARVFVIGVGVAGLQAIATAKRLGARVDAFDTRPAVEDQVKSLGAKFIKIDLGETGETDQGYARELTPEQIQKQQDGMAKVCAQSDVVITTAQVFGRPAPQILTEKMVKEMKRGSLVIDMAVSTGGNVEGSQPGQEVVVGGATVVGPVNLPGEVPFHASQMIASNVYHLVHHLHADPEKPFSLDLQDDLVKGCLLTHDGTVIHPRLTQSKEA